MPFTEEEKKERKRIADKKYYEKNKKKIQTNQKNYKKNWREKHKTYAKKYYAKNKERILLKQKELPITPKRKKSRIIAGWKFQGIICDYQHYYKIYLQQTNCYYCRKEFKNTGDRNLDHNHNITDDYNVRGILCRKCNTKDVY